MDKTTSPNPDATHTRDPNAGPLSGVRIAAFTQFLLGPSAVSYLAELGADVVSVEPVGGTWERSWSGAETMTQGQSLFYKMTHRNMRSLAVDLKTTQGQEVAWRLIEESDVVVQNFRPTVMKRLGLDYDSVRSRCPNVIYASCSGWGETGVRKDYPGQDLLLQAFSGLASINGRRQMPPVPCGAPVVDQHGASLLAMGILASLVQRARTGQGDHVKLTMLAGALDLQLEPFTYHINGAPLTRSAYGVSAPDHEAPYGIYECLGGHLALSMVALKRLETVLGIHMPDEWIEAPYRHRDDISQVVAQRLSTETLEHIYQTLTGHNIWCEPVLNYTEMMQEQAFTDIDAVGSFNDPVVGDVFYLRSPIQFETYKERPMSIPPSLGQNSSEILSELGYTETNINLMTNDGVVLQHDASREGASHASS